MGTSAMQSHAVGSGNWCKVVLACSLQQCGPLLSRIHGNTDCLGCNVERVKVLQKKSLPCITGSQASPTRSPLLNRLHQLESPVLCLLK
eukprot:373832-Amphidinium_carterae.1